MIQKTVNPFSLKRKESFCYNAHQAGANNGSDSEHTSQEKAYQAQLFESNSEMVLSYVYLVLKYAGSKVKRKKNQDI